MDSVEILTTIRRGLLRRDVTGEQTSVDDLETVLRWLRGMGRNGYQTLIVHRGWGSMSTIAEKSKPPGDVLLSAGDGTYYATAPGSDIPRTQPQLTPAQVEHIMVDGLTSPAAPRWPRWQRF